MAEQLTDAALGVTTFLEGGSDDRFFLIYTRRPSRIFLPRCRHSYGRCERTSFMIPKLFKFWNWPISVLLRWSIFMEIFYIAVVILSYHSIHLPRLLSLRRTSPRLTVPFNWLNKKMLIIHYSNCRTFRKMNCIENCSCKLLVCIAWR